MILNQTIGDCLTNYFMKIVLNLILMFSIIGISFSQSNKEQIQILGSRLDSLKTIQSNEKQSFEKRKNELESSITLSHQKTAELLKELSIKNENLQNQISENQKLDQDILSLKLELKSIEDSIQIHIDNQPIILLDNSYLGKSDNEIIKLLNISNSDFYEGFFTIWNGSNNTNNVNTIDYLEISGKQLFQLSGTKYCVAVVQVQSPNSFVSSEGTSILALFKINNGFWTLLSKYNTNFGGQLGNPSDLDKFSLMGDKTLAVELSNFSQGQGSTHQYRMIYALVNNEFVLVYQGDKHWDEFGRAGSSANSSDTEVTFIKSKSKFSDLQVKVQEEGKKVKTTTLKFNETTMKYE
jgi:hypothetical protein